MKNRFSMRVPKKPEFRRETYQIPPEYSKAYDEAGIVNLDEHAILFHCTQFGGFRCKERIPGYLAEKIGKLSKYLKTKNEDGRTVVSPNHDFLAQFGTLELQPIQRDWSRKQVVSETDMLECGFDEHYIKDSKDFVSALNDFYSIMRIAIPIPTSGISAEDRLRLERLQGVPGFKRSARAGGRLFHFEYGTSYQIVSSIPREGLTINGEETVEIDLKAAVLQFIELIAEDELPNHPFNREINQFNDPYQFFLSVLNSDNFQREFEEPRKISRESLKGILYPLIYCEHSKEKGTVNLRLRRLGSNFHYSALRDNFPCFFEVLDYIKNSDLPPHQTIYRRESAYAQRVLEVACLEEHLPVLPLHDAFITTKTNQNRLEEVMQETSRDMFGKVLRYAIS